MSIYDELVGSESVYTLAELADVNAPLSDSPGGRWLADVWESGLEGYDLETSDGRGMAVWEMADGAVPVYTDDLWRVFVDLAAYREDLSDWGPIGDMLEAARMALCQVAERLLNVWLARYVEAVEELEDDATVS